MGKQKIEYHQKIPDFLKGVSGEMETSRNNSREKSQNKQYVDDDPQIIVLKEGDLTKEEVNNLKQKGFSFHEDEEKAQESQEQELEIKKQKMNKALLDYERETGKRLFREVTPKKTRVASMRESYSSANKAEFQKLGEETSNPDSGRKSKLMKLSFEEEE
jgi:hypothetical protein